MLAIDTNVIVRYLADDHAEQAEKARMLVDGNGVFVTTTVLLETGWVLRVVLGLDRARLGQALRGFCGLPTVSLENPALAARALDWHERGMDLADAFHLAGSTTCDAFVTFDRDCVRVGSPMTDLPVRLP